MEPKDDAGRPLSPPPPPSAQAATAAQAILKTFLQGEGVAMVDDEGLDGIETGLQALLGGVDEDEGQEGDGAGAAGPTFVTEGYARKGDGGRQPAELELSLVASKHSLWGHRLWNAAIVLGEMFDVEDPGLVRRKACLELGAGAGLPSLLAALNGASKVVISDYASTTDRALVDAIQQNIDRLVDGGHVQPDVLSAAGYVWGQPVDALLAPLGDSAQRRFDVIICADLIFNRSEHRKLLWTCRQCLPEDGESGCVLVAYSHHDPGKRALDMRFFALAEEEEFGFVVEDVKEQQCVDLFVENDGLDEERGRVYIKRLRRRKKAAAVDASADGK